MHGATTKKIPLLFRFVQEISEDIVRSVSKHDLKWLQFYVRDGS